MAEAPRILRNIVNYTAGQAGIAIFGLLGSAILARYMTKPAFGQFSYFVAVALILVPILDGGATGYYTRQSSRQRHQAGQHWARAIAIRLYAAPITMGILAAYFYFANGRIDTSFFLVFAYAVAQSVYLSTDVAFRAKEQGSSWALRRIVYESTYLFMTIVALIAFGFTGPIQQFSLAIVAILVGASWAFVTVVRMTELTWREFIAEIARPLTFEEIKTLWPFAINSILYIFYYRLTAVFVEHFASSSELADFRVGFVVMTSALYLPKAIIWAATPRAALHDELGEKDKFNNILRQSAGANLFICTLLTVGGLLYGQRIIGLAFGPKYAHLGMLWLVMDLSMGLFFIQQFCTDMLINLHRERHVVRTMAAGVALLTLVNIILIPKYGAVGAAVARVVAGLVMVPLNLRALVALVGGKNLHGFSIWRFLAANVVVAAIGLALLDVNYWLSLAVFLLAYIGLNYLVGAIPPAIPRILSRLWRQRRNAG